MCLIIRRRRGVSLGEGMWGYIWAKNLRVILWLLKNNMKGLLWYMGRKTRKEKTVYRLVHLLTPRRLLHQSLNNNFYQNWENWSNSTRQIHKKLQTFSILRSHKTTVIRFQMTEITFERRMIYLWYKLRKRVWGGGVGSELKIDRW